MSDAGPVIELRGVTFGYPSADPASPVLSGVTLTVPRDDFLGVIGPNGGGKSTLLKIILGLLTPQGGEVRVFGRPPRQVRWRIGYVPQHAGMDLAAPASVLDVVCMGRLHRSSWGPVFGRSHVGAAMEALRQTGTADLARRSVRQLSGGQRQRVLIARALASDAELLLLDEPTAGVDEQAERGLTELLHELNRRLPIVMVSHDVGFVSAQLKRVACLAGTLTVHAAAEVTHELIARMYHDGVAAVRHHEHCPAAPPQHHEGAR
ncbi:MAG: Vitamin B12 import ATP-binding protein BtuD [Phycisphaerae bacterium]|nr:Vitamin B12 import ATP-binding protein BtuD [Phycisphaerae bacterium]